MTNKGNLIINSADSNSYNFGFFLLRCFMVILEPKTLKARLIYAIGAAFLQHYSSTDTHSN